MGLPVRKHMLYYSLNNQSPKTSFKDATIKGQAPDKGLYFPQYIPEFPKALIKNINSLAKEDIAYTCIAPYVGDTIPPDELKRIIRETIAFDFPLVTLSDSIYSLELFHGPTLAFKDVGARFMSRCLRYFVQDSTKQVTVLVATSGDTGGAVASGFYDVEGINVVILYPAGKVSQVQELQLTTYGKNIRALEIQGTFDDCQQLVKQAFADDELTKILFLTSANSINVARWLPQQFYYLFAYQQWKYKNDPPVYCVPSGNFGNVCAGLLARRSGLPAKHFIAACNANQVVPAFLQSGSYLPQKAISTLSNAMDVGDPSNFVRMLEIFGREFNSLTKVLSSYTISDNETTEAIKEVYLAYNYLMDPHGAVAYTSLKRYFQENPGQKGIFLETAHPIKFYDVVEPVINEKIPVPASVQSLLGITMQKTAVRANYIELKNILLS
jgi:threonine synthase